MVRKTSPTFKLTSSEKLGTVTTMNKEPTYKVTKTAVSIPLCYKCSSKVSEPSPKDAVVGVIPQILTGCKDLTAAEWEEGNRIGKDGIRFQHNCPITPKELNE
jgi:hypothetical protein